MGLVKQLRDPFKVFNTFNELGDEDFGGEIGAAGYGGGGYSTGTEQETSDYDSNVVGGLIGTSVEGGFFSTTTVDWNVTDPNNMEVVTNTSYFGGLLETETTDIFGGGEGQNQSSDTVVSIFGESAFNYDTHYDNQNIEASFFTEQIADFFDLIDSPLTPETIGTMSLIEDTAKVVATGVPTSTFAMLQSGKLGFQVLGALSMYGKANTYAGIAERLGGTTPADQQSNSMFEGGSEAINVAINSLTQTTQTAIQPLTAPLLSPITRYASLASIVNDSKRQDFSYQTMNMFRPGYGTEILNQQQFTIGGINEYKIGV